MKHIKIENASFLLQNTKFKGQKYWDSRFICDKKAFNSIKKLSCGQRNWKRFRPDQTNMPAVNFSEKSLIIRQGDKNGDFSSKKVVCSRPVHVWSTNFKVKRKFHKKFCQSSDHLVWFDEISEIVSFSQEN